MGTRTRAQTIRAVKFSNPEQGPSQARQQSSTSPYRTRAAKRARGSGQEPSDDEEGSTAEGTSN